MSAYAFLNPLYLHDHAGRSEQVLLYLPCVGIVKLLLLRVGLRGIPGATDTTRTTTPRVIVSLYHAPPVKKASKKAKTVDNESRASEYCTGTSVRVARVVFLPRIASAYVLK